MKRMVVKTPADKLRAIADQNMAVAETRASEHLAALLKKGDAHGDESWQDVTIRDKAAMAFAGFHASRSRAKINADAGPKVLGVVMIPQRIADKGAWEARARELEAQGRRVIDTTVGPALVGTKGDE